MTMGLDLQTQEQYGWQASTPQTILDSHLRVIADALGFRKSNPARLDWIIVRIAGLMETENDVIEGRLVEAEEDRDDAA